MIIPDVNLLVYAHDSTSRRHAAARSLTTDAHLAALAIEHQVELHSTDADMARLPGLRWRNPLA